jgi:anthranilate 1,2-dioxygenase small subunit
VTGRAVTAGPDLQQRLARTQADYARAIDDGALDRWPEFFDEPCRYVVTTADNYRNGLEAGLIYADSRGMLRDRISALHEANIYEQHSYRHLLGHPCILSVDGDEVRSETSFMIARIMRTGETSLFATGRYVDRYRVSDDRLFIRERIVICDSSQVDTLMALPL